MKPTRAGKTERKTKVKRKGEERAIKKPKHKKAKNAE
jgi:hypothetical protein